MKHRTSAIAICGCVLLAACSSDEQSDIAAAESGAAATTSPETGAPPSARTRATEPPSTTPPTSVEQPAGDAAPATSAPSPEPPPSPFAPFAPIDIRDRECPGNPSATVRCVWVVVPADWDDPAGSRIELPVTILPAKDTAAPDPLVIPAGGPGFDAAQDYGYRNAPHNAERDIVLYDQRGTGLAVPNLECPEVDAVFVENLQRDEPFEVELSDETTAALDCRARLEAEGIDLDDYDSIASARDLDAIRVALGYDRWNILGISYGARLALTAMRETPDSIRSVILDSVYDVTYGGPAATIASAERAFGVLADACAEQVGCAAAYDVRVLIDEAVATLDAEPLTVDADVGNGRETFVVTGADALAGLFNAMYDPDLIAILPLVIEALSRGEAGLVPSLLEAGVRQGTGAADAMQLSVDCADNAGLDQAADEALAGDPGRQRLLALATPCSVWPVDPTSPTFNEPVVSSIPALVLAGRFDPVTPPEASERVADRLPNATFVLIADGAHGVTGPLSPCAESIGLDFLDDPTAELDISCADTIGQVAFAGG